MTPEEILDHADAASLWPPGAAAAFAGNVPSAYRSALAVRALRIARGERPAGFKVGFTNRTIWPRYGVWAPIWGTVWRSTLRRCEGHGTIDLSGTVQPRIEPEVAFGMLATPPDRATLEQVFECVEWLAPAFEIVQSHCADWKFTAAEAVADGALHAKLLVGSATAVSDVAASAQALDERLGALGVELSRNGTPIERGVGANVLDGPLHALAHFVRELQACPGAPSLQAGDVVTTGTWTDAWPLQPGEVWSATFDAPLSSLRATMS